MSEENELAEVFGQEFVENIKDKTKDELTEDEEMEILIASLRDNIDKCISETLTVLSNMDAEEQQDVFSAFEDMLKKLNTMEAFLTSHHVMDVKSKDYELGDDI